MTRLYAAEGAGAATRTDRSQSARGGGVRTSRFVLVCDLKVGDSVLLEGRPYLVTALEQASAAVVISSGTWSITVAPDNAVQVAVGL